MKFAGFLKRLHSIIIWIYRKRYYLAFAYLVFEIVPILLCLIYNPEFAKADGKVQTIVSIAIFQSIVLVILKALVFLLIITVLYKFLDKQLSKQTVQ